MKEFYLELSKLIENITGWSTAFNKLRPESNTIGIMDTPAALGTVRLNKTRERNITFQVSVKSDSSIDALETAEKIYQELDFHRVLSGDNWVAEIMPYVSPSFGYEDENERTIYVMMFQAIKINKGEI